VLHGPVLYFTITGTLRIGCKDGDAGQPGRAPTPPTSERTYFRLVIESGQVLEAFRAADGRFWLERIID